MAVDVKLLCLLLTTFAGRFSTSNNHSNNVTQSHSIPFFYTVKQTQNYRATQKKYPNTKLAIFT